MSIYANDPFFLLSGGIAPKKLWQALSQAMEGSGYEQRYKEGGTPRRSRRSLARPMPKKKKPVPYRFEAFQFRLPADKWPGDWRLYSTYDGIFITEREYSALGADARSALETYRAFGGAVIVTKGRDGFADAQEAVAALKPIDDSCEALVGDLQIDYYFHSDNRNLLGDLKRIPIESKSTVPVKTLLAVLALFACVVVPVAVLRSVRRNTRIRLLALLPGAAAVFAAAVAVSAYAFFGVTPTTRLQSITVLDQTTKKAVTRGQFGVFSPVSMDGCIAFPSDAVFALRHASGNGDESATVESAGEQRLMEGWVKPLVSSFFDFARACERPERLDFRVSPDGGVSVVNLLGAKVKWGHANVGGKLWTFKDVEPGATAKAEELGKPFVPPKAARRPFGDELTSWGRDWKTSVERAKQSVQETPPGEYAVEVEGSPFFPDPVQGKKSRMSAAGLVFGKFKEVAE